MKFVKDQGYFTKYMNVLHSSQYKKCIHMIFIRSDLVNHPIQPTKLLLSTVRKHGLPALDRTRDPSDSSQPRNALHNEAVHTVYV